MKTKLPFVAVCTATLLAALPSICTASTVSTRQITYLQSDARACSFFQLNGVGEADPVLPGNPWFSLPQANPAYQQMLAELLSAKLAGKPVDIWTDGTTSCGYATVIRVQIDP